MKNETILLTALRKIADMDGEHAATFTDCPTIAREALEHFGESAPEQKEENVARIYADGRWIHAECLLCAWSGVKWKAHKGSGLPNAKAILQHSLRDHLLFKHVEKLPVAPSVDTNAEPNCSAAHPERLQLHCMLIRGHDGDHANGYVVWLADAPQEPTCARCGEEESSLMHDYGNGVMIIEFGAGTSNDESHTFVPPVVESSVLPSKSDTKEPR